MFGGSTAFVKRTSLTDGMPGADILEFGHHLNQLIDQKKRLMEGFAEDVLRHFA